MSGDTAGCYEKIRRHHLGEDSAATDKDIKTFCSKCDKCFCLDCFDEKQDALEEMI